MKDQTGQAPAFDADLYRRAYPDVALTGLDPEYHYQRYGRMLGRDPAPQIAPWPEPPTLDQLQAATGPAELDLLFARGAVRSVVPPRHADLVSVIMPSFNNARWLPRAINSVLSQQGAHVELIVIDDGSSDDSVAIARRIAETVDNMRVISLLRNFGCYYARNVGVMAARGDYVALLDSDDIMSPDRIARQLDAVKARPDAVASQSRLRRWSADYRQPLTELKHAENSLMWRRDIVQEIGPYDSVRFGGDTEFRVRLQARYGADAIARLPDEQYFLRRLEDSLTTQPGSEAYVVEDGVLKMQLSPERRAYAENQAVWHRAAAPLRMAFPQFSRPFALGSPAQAAAATLGQRRVGVMAGLPAGRAGLAAAVRDILPQLDELVLCPGDDGAVPDIPPDPRIRVLRGAGRFHDLPGDDGSYVFTLDGGLIYPPDYTARLIHHIDMLGRGSVVGLHGTVFPERARFTRRRQRRISHALDAYQGHFVDLLGAGTMAWHSSTLKPKPEDFDGTGGCELWFAALAARQDVPLFSIPRAAGWIGIRKASGQVPGDEARDRPRHYFDIYHKLVAPALRKGAVRLGKEAELARRYSPDALAAAGILLRGHYDRA